MDWKTKLIYLFEILSVAHFSLHEARIAKNFQGCSKYFLGNSPPSGFKDTSYSKGICQNDNYGLPDVFATLYDTKHKIPSFSAYIMDRDVLSGRVHTWHTEKEIDPSEQAHLSDYKYNMLDRGHLCPSIYVSKANRKAAYTLTNVVPQYGFFNQHIWNKAEQKGQKIMLTSCVKGKAYFITGAIPGHATMKTRHGSMSFDTGVNIPSRMYTAACCKFQNGDSFSFGYIGKNVIANETTNYTNVMNVMDVKLLGRRIGEVYYNSDSIKFFNGNCDISNKTALNLMAKTLKVPVYSHENLVFDSSLHRWIFMLAILCYYTINVSAT